MSQSSSTPSRATSDRGPAQELIAAIPYERTHVMDPHPVYQEMLSANVTRYDGGYVITNRKGILKASANKDIFGIGGRGAILGAKRQLIPLGLDGKDHRHYRRLLDPLFAPRSVMALRDKVRKRAIDLIDGFVADGRTELFSSFCEPFPSAVFIDFFGLPGKDIGWFHEFKDVALKSIGSHNADSEEHVAAAEELQRQSGEKMYAYLDSIIAERRASPGGEDLVSQLIRVEHEGHRLSDDEIKDILFILVIAGLDTVTATLSCMFEWLARHPEHRKRLSENPGDIPAAVEELLRIQSPVTANVKFPMKDVELAPGMIAHPGEAIVLVNASANLDPEVFVDPLKVDFDRENASMHMAFAAGFHRCLGSHLARLELETALAAFLSRIPNYRLISDQSPGYTNNFIRTIKPLPIEFDT